MSQLSYSFFIAPIYEQLRRPERIGNAKKIVPALAHYFLSYNLIAD